MEQVRLEICQILSTGAAIGGLSNMTTMDLSANEISGLMDFAGTAITNLNISTNNLLF